MYKYIFYFSRSVTILALQHTVYASAKIRAQQESCQGVTMKKWYNLRIELQFVG